jgi:hypothetical protein
MQEHGVIVKILTLPRSEKEIRKTPISGLSTKKDKGTNMKQLMIKVNCLKT